MSTLITGPQMSKLEYLMEQYKLYHGHINNMFNYFLVLEGLIANAYVVSISKEAEVSYLVSTVIGVFGAFATVMMLMIHNRSRSLLDTIEYHLKIEEGLLFGNNSPGFLTYIEKGGKPINTDSDEPRWKRHKYQFVYIYRGFIALFIGAALYSALNGLGVGIAEIRNLVCE